MLLQSIHQLAGFAGQQEADVAPYGGLGVQPGQQRGVQVLTAKARDDQLLLRGYCAGRREFGLAGELVSLRVLDLRLFGVTEDRGVGTDRAGALAERLGSLVIEFGERVDSFFTLLMTASTAIAPMCSFAPKATALSPT